MSLMCIHPSADFRSKVAAIAAAEGLSFLAPESADQAMILLASHEPVKLLLLAEGGMEPLSGDGVSSADSSSDTEDVADLAGLSLIEEVRLLSHRATLPIAFILQNRDLNAARQAFRAGTTEVFEVNDDTGLRSFVREIVREVARGRSVPDLTGRVLLLEDSPSHGAFVAHVCKALGLSVDLVATVEEGRKLFSANRYQLAVVDIVLDGVQSGLAMVRDIRRKRGAAGRLPVLVMSGFADVSRRIEALRCGASDFLHKPFAEEEFVWRVRRLLQDQATDDTPDAADDAESAGSPTATGSVAAGQGKWRRLGLTAREAQVCDALLGGGADKVIAEELGISFWTVRTHIQRVFAKLGVLNRRELMVRYLTSRDTP
jgi:DNA-binding NarL/FixJ family response regulator